MNNSPRNELQAQVAAILKLCPQDPGASAAPVSDNETLHRLPAQSSHARHPSGVPRILPPVLEPPSLGYDRRTATPDGTQYGVDRASTSDKGLQTNDSSEKLDFRPLKRSPTFSDEGMREGSLPQQWSPSRQANVEKSSSDYWSDTREETNPCSTPPTSFNPSEIGSSPCPPAVHNRESDFRGIGGGVPLDDNDLDDSIYTDHEQESPPESQAAVIKQHRFYTSQLGVPELEKSNISELSVVSDAGDQQHIRQRILTRVEEVRYNGDEQLGSFPTPLERHELQKVIFSAIEDTWNPDIPHLDAGILPNAQLRRLINPNSVFRELTKDMTYVQVQEEGDSIWKIALDVCAETEVLHDGKEKIKSFRKVFAALVLAESSALISLFIKEGVSDLDLPLVTYGDRRRMELRRRDTFDQPSKKSLECFKHPSWSPVKIDTFKREQWKMLAPFFSQGDCGDVKHYPLMNQRILPFMASHLPNDKVVEHRGGFGKVFIVHIHKDHHNFGDALACSRGFAVKQLYEDDREAFDKERKILKRFSGDRSHRHVVSLLATYEHLGKFHLIFHAAEADLLKFWKHRSFNTQFEPDSIKWMARQCAGIAHGLLQLHRHITFVRSSSYPDVEEELVHKPSGESQVRIQLPTHLKREVFRSSSNDTETPDSSRRIDDSHQYFVEPRIRSVQRTFTEELKQETKFGRHGDINPQNILLYHDSDEDNDSLTGTLKLSDFGEAEINSRFSRSKRRSVANTLTYRPPECDLSPRIIRQSYDIWCLGCVYLEFVTWMLGGYQLLCRFSKYRRSPDIFQPGQETDTFFQVVISAENDHPGVMVKPKVTKFINFLHQHPDCTDFYHDILNLIQNSMVVVESSRRKSCQEVWQALEGFSEKCTSDPAYVEDRSPWCASSVTAEPFTHSVDVDLEGEAQRVVAENRSSLPVHTGHSESDSVSFS